MTNPIVELTRDQILDCRQRMHGQWHALGIAPDGIDALCDMAIRAITPAELAAAGKREPFGWAWISKDGEILFSKQCTYLCPEDALIPLYAAPVAPVEGKEEARKIIKQLREVSSYSQQYSICQSAAAILASAHGVKS